MIGIVTHLWQQPKYHTSFTAHHVNVLKSMVDRHYSGPHKFICITDMPEGLDSDIEVLPLNNLYSNLENPSIKHGPSCYRRLRVFSKEAAATFKVDKVVALDLDTVIVNDLSPLWDKEDDLVVWRDPLFVDVTCNGSMVMFKPGVLSFIWDNFDPVKSPQITTKAKLLGSDQAWISYALKTWYQKPLTMWGREDGVYSFRLMTNPKMYKGIYTEPLKNHELPKNARIIFFHGRNNPWDADVQEKYPWVRDNWK